MSTGTNYRLGLTEVADGVFAYLQPDGSWGYSNAGLVTGDGTALLVDTLFDKALTRSMLESMGPVLAGRPIDVLVNTHSNGDHTFGNELVHGARIVASTAATKEMEELPASVLHALKGMDLGEDGNRFVQDAFGPFRFDDISDALPSETFDEALAVAVGGTDVRLEVVGPAHTGGDVIAHVPGAGVVFTGDICFHGSTPIVWAGPVSNWVAACGRIRALEPTVVVPGHGPVGDLAAIDGLERYFTWLVDEVRSRHGAGLGAVEAAWDIELGEYGEWSDRERTVVNVDAIYAEIDPGYQRLDVITALAEMGRYRYHR